MHTAIALNTLWPGPSSAQLSVFEATHEALEELRPLHSWEIAAKLAANGMLRCEARAGLTRANNCPIHHYIMARLASRGLTWPPELLGIDGVDAEFLVSGENWRTDPDRLYRWVAKVALPPSVREFVLVFDRGGFTPEGDLVRNSYGWPVTADIVPTLLGANAF